MKSEEICRDSVFFFIRKLADNEHVLFKGVQVVPVLAKLQHYPGENILSKLKKKRLHH